MGVEIGSFNMNKLIVLALFAGLYFCGVAKVAAGKGKALVNTKCLQLISCNGVCSIDAPGSSDEWDEDTTEDCDKTRGCKCWKPSVRIRFGAPQPMQLQINDLVSTVLQEDLHQ